MHLNSFFLSSCRLFLESLFTLVITYHPKGAIVSQNSTNPLSTFYVNKSNVSFGLHSVLLVDLLVCNLETAWQFNLNWDTTLLLAIYSKLSVIISTPPIEHDLSYSRLLHAINEMFQQISVCFIRDAERFFVKTVRCVE